MVALAVCPTATFPNVTLLKDAASDPEDSDPPQPDKKRAQVIAAAGPNRIARQRSMFLETQGNKLPFVATCVNQILAGA